MLMMEEQRAFNATVEKKSMLFKSTKLHYWPTKIEKKAFMLQVGPDGLKTIFCWYCTHVWQKQIIGIFTNCAVWL